MPVHYECVRCTECCRWPGQVRLSDAEISRMAEFLGVSEFDFIDRYTRLRADRRGLALRDAASRWAVEDRARPIPRTAR